MYSEWCLPSKGAQPTSQMYNPLPTYPSCARYVQWVVSTLWGSWTHQPDVQSSTNLHKLYQVCTVSGVYPLRELNPPARCTILYQPAQVVQGMYSEWCLPSEGAESTSQMYNPLPTCPSCTRYVQWVVSTLWGSWTHQPDLQSSTNLPKLYQVCTVSGVYPLRALNPPARCTILYQPTQVVPGMYSEWCLPSEGAEPTSQMYNPLPTYPSCTRYVQWVVSTLWGSWTHQPDVQSSTNLPKLYQVCTVSGVYPLRELNPPARCTILYQPTQVVPGMYSEWCLPSEGAESTSQMYNPLPTYPSCARYVQWVVSTLWGSWTHQPDVQSSTNLHKLYQVCTVSGVYPLRELNPPARCTILYQPAQVVPGMYSEWCLPSEGAESTSQMYNPLPTYPSCTRYVQWVVSTLWGSWIHQPDVQSSTNLPKLYQVCTVSGVYPLRELNPPARCTILYQPTQVVQGMYSEWCLPSEGAEPTSQMYNPLPTYPSCTRYVQWAIDSEWCLPSEGAEPTSQMYNPLPTYPSCARYVQWVVSTLWGSWTHQPDVQSSTNLPKLYQVCTVSGVYPLRELNPPARCTILYQPTQVVQGMYSEWCLPSEGAQPTSQMYNPLPTCPSCTRYVQWVVSTLWGSWTHQPGVQSSTNLPKLYQVCTVSGVYLLRELNPPARCTILYQPAQVVPGMYSEWCLPSKGAQPTSQMYNLLPTCPSCARYVQWVVSTLWGSSTHQPDVQSSTNLPKLCQVCTVSGVYPLRELNPPARCTILYQPAQVVPGMYSYTSWIRCMNSLTVLNRLDLIVKKSSN